MTGRSCAVIATSRPPFLTEVLCASAVGSATRRSSTPPSDHRRRADGHLRPAIDLQPRPRRCRRAAQRGRQVRRARTSRRARSWRRAATRTSSASTGTSRRGCRSGVPRCAYAAHRRRRLVHAPARGPVRRCSRATSCAGAPSPRWRPRCRSWWACTRRCGTPPTSTSTRVLQQQRARRPDCSPTGCGAVVPGFLERYGHAFAPDEVDFYERLAQSAARLVRRPPAGAQPGAQ